MHITTFTAYYALASCVQHNTARALTMIQSSSSPTRKPTGTQIATYDEKLGAPHCKNVGSECNSLNQIDESIEQIIVRAVSGGTMAMGTEIEVTASVYTATNRTGRDDPFGRDVGRIFYAPDANNVTWQFKGGNSVDPNTGHSRQFVGRFTLAFGSSTQAVRLSYGYLAYDTQPCKRSQDWHDFDDLVFTVAYGAFPHPSSQPSTSDQPSGSPSTAPTTSMNPTTPTVAPTTSMNPTIQTVAPTTLMNPTIQTAAPTTSINPTISTSIQPTPKSNSVLLTAVYNTSLEAPYCPKIGSSCSSGLLLDGSGSLEEGSHRESNAPNTIDDCTGDQGTSTSSGIKPIYHQDETIDKILIQSVDEGLLRIGTVAEVKVILWSPKDTTKRSNPNKWSVAHVYYAPKVEANNITWKYVWSEVVASSQGEYTFTTRLNLVSDLLLKDGSSTTVTQAVRVSYAYAQYKPNQCPENMGYTDVDDLVFEVLLTQPTTAPTKDLTLSSAGNKQWRFWCASAVVWMHSLFTAAISMR